MSRDNEVVIRVDNFRDMKKHLGLYILNTAFKNSMKSSVIRATKLLLEDGAHFKCDVFSNDSIMFDVWDKRVRIELHDLCMSSPALQGKVRERIMADIKPIVRRAHAEEGLWISDRHIYQLFIGEQLDRNTNSIGLGQSRGYPEYRIGVIDPIAKTAPVA